MNNAAMDICGEEVPAKAVAENAIVAAAAITIGFNNFFIFIQILSQDMIFSFSISAYR